MRSTQGIVTMVAGIYALVLLSVSLLVSAETDETIVFDDFDDPEIYNLWEMDHLKGTATVNVRDGYVFLNITDKTNAGQQTNALLWHGSSANPYRYAGMEVRLKCSDDNRLESDIGGGYRLWGFWDFTGPHSLYFYCASPESGEGAGFYAFSEVTGVTKLNEPIAGIDIREWHKYTVIWEPDNATFLIDDEVVAQTDQVHKNRMDTVIANYNVKLPAGWHNTIDVPFNESIQVDYIHIFGVPETTIPVIPPIITILGLILLPTLLRRRYAKA